MIDANLHDDMKNPANIPGFLNITPKKPRKDLLANAIEGAAVAFTGVDPKGQTNDLCNEKTSCNHPFALLTFSLGKLIELRVKSYEQLGLPLGHRQKCFVFSKWKKQTQSTGYISRDSRWQ